MDTSEQFIRMCGKAEEIQKYWPSNGCSFFVDKPVDYSKWYPVHESEKPEWYWHFIWLPRQDQLQEMVKYFRNLPPAEYSARGLSEAFWAFVDGNWVNYLWILSDEQTSMEQLWLAFVMKEKHGKVWDGEDWRLP